MAQLPPLWVCGDTQIQLFDLNNGFKPGAPLWAWDAKTADMPEERRKLFYAVDEVKPVIHAGEPCVLITASWEGGAALIRRSDRKLLFSVPLKNAHSAELLPNGWIAVAGSGGSDKLVIHQISAGPLAEGSRAEFPLHHGHGAVYERGRKLLWVSGASTARVYAWTSDERSFSCEALREIALPDVGAHDLMADSFAGGLIFTNNPGVYRLDTKSDAIVPFAPLAGQGNVKGVSVETSSGALAYMQGELPNWWGDTFHVVGGDGQRKSYKLPGRQLYKVRWDQSCQLP